MNEQRPDQEEAESDSSQSDSSGTPERLLKTGEALVDEEEVVVAEVNGLAYTGGVLTEIAWRYNKYPGLRQGHERLRATICEYAERLRSNVEAAEEYDDSEGERNYSGALQILRTLFPDVLGAGDPDQSRDIVDELRTLEEEMWRFREAITKHRSHDRISGTGILRTAAEQVDSVALARDLRSMASDIDAALGGGGDDDE
jgi:hypothetical protein